MIHHQTWELPEKFIYFPNPNRKTLAIKIWQTFP